MTTLNFFRSVWTTLRRRQIFFIGLAVFSTCLVGVGDKSSAALAGDSTVAAPAPLLAKGHAVDWWVVFKFNADSFQGCDAHSERQCSFGGKVKDYGNKFSQQFVVASSEHPTLQKGVGCAGDTATDPLGATFAQVYNGSYYYVIWNDQFYDAPAIKGCEKSCGAPWGHSKGLLGWNERGEGLVMQVSTPSWPASGSKQYPRKNDGNTLGCINDDDVEVSQHFFALKLNKEDLIQVLRALQNSSVVTDPTNKQIVNNGGPQDVQDLVSGLGTHSPSETSTRVKLSSGVQLISKPSHLHVPPWQLVSAALQGLSLRVASWWAHPEIPTTTKFTKIGCWDKSLGPVGSVEIATSGQWQGTVFGLTGGLGLNYNHAKIGVSTNPAKPYSIFGDLNQQGALTGPTCASSQNGRGGTFYVLQNSELFKSLTDLLKGKTASDTLPQSGPKQ